MQAASLLADGGALRAQALPSALAAPDAEAVRAMLAQLWSATLPWLASMEALPRCLALVVLGQLQETGVVKVRASRWAVRRGAAPLTLNTTQHGDELGTMLAVLQRNPKAIKIAQRHTTTLRALRPHVYCDVQSLCVDVAVDGAGALAGVQLDDQLHQTLVDVLTPWYAAQSALSADVILPSVYNFAQVARHAAEPGSAPVFGSSSGVLSAADSSRTVERARALWSHKAARGAGEERVRAVERRAASEPGEEGGGDRDKDVRQRKIQPFAVGGDDDSVARRLAVVSRQRQDVILVASLVSKVSAAARGSSAAS